MTAKPCSLGIFCLIGRESRTTLTDLCYTDKVHRKGQGKVWGRKARDSSNKLVSSPEAHTPKRSTSSVHEEPIDSFLARVREKVISLLPPLTNNLLHPRMVFPTLGKGTSRWAGQRAGALAARRNGLCLCCSATALASAPCLIPLRK